MHVAHDEPRVSLRLERRTLVAADGAELREPGGPLGRLAEPMEQAEAQPRLRYHVLALERHCERPCTLGAVERDEEEPAVLDHTRLELLVDVAALAVQKADGLAHAM